MPLFDADELEDFVARVLVSRDLPESDAQTAARVLVSADRRGIVSHGVSRLHIYVDMLDVGNINPRPNLRVVHETPSTATVDGDGGMGLVVGPWAHGITLEKAEQVGTGWVAVQGSNHYGIAGWYTLRSVERDMIGWAMTNTTVLVAPLWGVERMLGTNPISVAFPAGEESPVVVDMATSAVAFGEIEKCMRADEPVPANWAVGRGGGEPPDAKAIVAGGGALRPLGGVRADGGHKGYCLAAFVDLLCGPLSGAAWGPFTPPATTWLPRPERIVGSGIGHFFGSMRVDAFRPIEDFKQSVDDWIRTFRTAVPEDGTGGPLIPGDPERQAEARSREHGVELSDKIVSTLRQVSQTTGCALPGMS
jgi:LDH2 family malate/lactate/ureidoglycolate dehydrogenase